MELTNLPVLHFLQIFGTGMVVSIFNLLFCLIFICMAQIHMTKGWTILSNNNKKLFIFIS